MPTTTTSSTTSSKAAGSRTSMARSACRTDRAWGSRSPATGSRTTRRSSRSSAAIRTIAIRVGPTGSRSCPTSVSPIPASRSHRHSRPATSSRRQFARERRVVNDAPLLGPEAISVLFDGTLSEPRLDHPACVAVDAEGGIWCGGERGQVFRLAADGSSLEEVACSGGFTLGIAFAPNGDLFLCDLKTASVLRLPAGSDRLETFADGAGGHRFRIPNSLAFDADGRLYVSDSHGFKDPGPGVFRFEPGGEGELWCAEVFDFANGIALAPDGSSLHVDETLAKRVVRGALVDAVAACALD